MKIILYDEPAVHKALYPLTLTRPVSELKTGILSIREKWAHHMNRDISWGTMPYLAKLYPQDFDNDNLIINSALLPDENLVKAISGLAESSSLVNDSGILAARVNSDQVPGPGQIFNPQGLKSVYFRHEVKKISKPWDLFLENGPEIIKDIFLITLNRNSSKMPDPFTRIYNERNVFIEKGVKIRSAILNAEDGPIYLGENAEIQEGSSLHGPVAVLEGAVISMGAKIRENTTIGRFCKVGGEVKNSIFLGNSNKAHDGYLGNSVIGEWCNLGANTNNSNLKNNYSNVKVWDYETVSFRDSGQQFCGVFMGDHSKTAIGTRINTGTVIGVSANIFGAGLTPKYIPSFSWGGYKQGPEYAFDKAIDSAGKMMSRRNRLFSEDEINMLKAVYDMTSQFRLQTP